ncbi:MAG: MoxR family ATPase [Syntrophomonas sp.]|nr:MoxR family ATPase [Syntrophomonas sp.]
MDDIQLTKEKMLQAGYICDDKVATVLYLAAALQKPVLVEGPAGVGKTAIAQAFSLVKGLPLIRLQCYEGLDEAKALYEWNYKRQLLHIQAAANQNLSVEEIEQDIFSDSFLLTRPLLQSITSDTPTVLLIDEIDKVDFEFEAMLLELLSEFQITIPEIGTVSARHHPFVFLTSNATRELSEALKRRCLYLYLDFPSKEMEQQILMLKIPKLPPRLAEKVAQVVRQLRGLELKKPPSIAESIDWAGSLLWLGKEDLDVESTLQTLTTVVKYREDQQKLERIIYRNRDLNFRA